MREKKKKHFILPQGKGVGERNGYCKSTNKQLSLSTIRTVKVPVGEMVSRGAERNKIPFCTRKHPGRVTEGSVVENVPCLLLCRKQYGKRGSGPSSGGADNSV